MLYALAGLLGLCAAALIVFHKKLSLRVGCYVAALLCAAAAFALAGLGAQRGVLAVRAASSPEETVTAFFDALCRGDGKAAAAYLDGGEDMNLTAEPEDEVTAALQSAVRASYACRLLGSAEQKGLEAVQRAEFTALDVGAMQGELREHVLADLERWVEERAYDAVYDENDQYRPEITDEAYRDAVFAALEHSGDFARTEELTLRLRCDDKGWHILPDAALLRAMNGYLAD